MPPPSRRPPAGVPRPHKGGTTVRLRELQLEVSRNLGTILHLRLLHAGSVCNQMCLHIYDSRHARDLADELRRIAAALEDSAVQAERLSLGVHGL